MSWRLGAGRYLRPPDMTELFGDRGAMHGNPQLRPEQGQSVEAGLSLEGGPPELQGRFDLALYRSRTEDLIVWVQNGQQVMVPVNIGAAQVRGLELGLNGQMLSWADLGSSLSWTLSENQSPQSAVQGRQLPRVPTLELSLGPQLHWEEKLRLGHQWSYTDGNYWDATNWYRSAPRSLHSAFVRVWPTPRWPTLELSVLNIADRIAEVVPRDPLNPEEGDAVSAITDFTGSPLPGRTLLFTMTWAP
jgi:outer membrane receptor protein involved in Fe transport